jgi:electron-transferring-flavoprotein dehydrogenase
MKSNFEPGMIFRSKVTLLAEGAHGSLSKIALKKYDLRKESEGPTYGFGSKEVWRIGPEGGLIIIFSNLF